MSVHEYARRELAWRDGPQGRKVLSNAEKLARVELEPAPREIPAGKILLSEYGDFDESQRAHYYKLERIPTASRELEVCRVSAGFEPAGSVARWTNGYYAVLWSASDGTRHGQHTKTLSEALELAQEWRGNDHERAENYSRALEEQPSA